MECADVRCEDEFETMDLKGYLFVGDNIFGEVDYIIVVNCVVVEA